MHESRPLDQMFLVYPKKPIPGRYPCDPLPTGGVSQLFVNDTNGYRSFLVMPTPFYFFFKNSAVKKIFRLLGVAVLDGVHA